MGQLYVYPLFPQTNPFILKKNSIPHKYISLSEPYFVCGDTLLEMATCDLRTQRINIKPYQSSYALYIPEGHEECKILNPPSAYQPIDYKKIDFRTIYRQQGSENFFKKSIAGLLYSPSKKLYVYNTWGKTTVWDLHRRTLIDEVDNSHNQHKVISAVLSNDEQYMICTFQYVNFLVITNLKTKKSLHIPVDYELHGQSKIKFATLQQKTYLIFTAGSKIFAYDFQKLLHGEVKTISMQKYKDPITSFDVVSENRLVSTDNKGRVIVWNLMNLNQQNIDRFLCELRGRSSQIIKDCVYSKKYKKLITVGSQVLIWDFN